MAALTGDLYNMARQDQKIIKSATPTFQLDAEPSEDSGSLIADARNKQSIARHDPEPSADLPTGQSGQRSLVGSTPFTDIFDGALEKIRLWRGEEYSFSPREAAALQAIVNGSENPQDDVDKFIASTAIGSMFGLDVSQVYSNLDEISQYYTGSSYMPNDSTLAEKIKAGIVTTEAQDLMISWQNAMLAGDEDTATKLESRIQAKLDSVGGIQAGIPQTKLKHVQDAVFGNLGYIADTMMHGGMLSMATTIGTTAIIAAAHLNPISAIAAYAAAGTYGAGAYHIGSGVRSKELATAQSFWDMMHSTEPELANPTKAAIFANINGFVTGATEALIDGVVSRGATFLTGKLPATFGVSMLANLNASGDSSRLAQGFLQWISGGLDEAFLNEFPQQMSDYLTQAAYRSSVGLPSGFSFKEMLEESWDAAVDGFIVGAVYGFAEMPATMRTLKNEAIVLRRVANATPSREAYFEATKDIKPEGVSQKDYDTAREQIFEASKKAQAEVYAGTVIESDEIAEKELDAGNRTIDNDGSIQFLRTGKLYHTDIDNGTYKDSTTVQNRQLRFGSPSTGARYGVLDYHIDTQTNQITIDELRVDYGYEAIRSEMVKDLSDMYPGYQIEWEPRTEQLQSIKDELVANNPLGKDKGLTYYDGTTSDVDGRLMVQNAIRQNMPGLTEEETFIASELLVLRAEAKGMSGQQYIDTHFQDGQLFGKKGDVKINDQRGAVAFGEDAKALIYTSRYSDFSTWAHEAFHVAAREMEQKTELSQALRDASTTEDFKTYLMDHAAPWGLRFDADEIIADLQNLDDNNWTRSQEENIARIYESWLSDGKVASPRLSDIFHRIAKFMAKVYNTLKHTVQLDERVAKGFESLYAQNSDFARLAADSTADVLFQSSKNEQTATDVLFRADDTVMSQVRQEYADTESMLRNNPNNFDADGNHLAPNGQPSNLTYEQWVQVRTPSFKQWFGDWESAVAVDWVMSSEPVAKLSELMFQKGESGNLVDRVLKYWGNRITVSHPELGAVILDKEGVKSSIGHGIGREKASGFALVPQIIENGRIVSRETNWKNRGYDTAVIAAPIQMGGVDYIAEAVVAQRPSSNKFYLHEVEIKERLKGAFKTPTEGSAPRTSRLIISKLLAEGKFNSSKVVDGNGEPQVVYHGTEMGGAFEIFDPSYIRSEDGFFFTDSMSIAKEFADDSMDEMEWADPHLFEVFLALKNPLIIDYHGDKYYGVEDEISRARANGNDGVIVRNVMELRYSDSKNLPSTDYIAFDSTQIKSATNNRGTFNANNPNILFQSANDVADEVLHEAQGFDSWEEFKNYYEGFVFVDDELPADMWFIDVWEKANKITESMPEPARIMEGTEADKDTQFIDLISDDAELDEFLKVVGDILNDDTLKHGRFADQDEYNSALAKDNLKNRFKAEAARNIKALANKVYKSNYELTSKERSDIRNIMSDDRQIRYYRDLYAAVMDRDDMLAQIIDENLPDIDSPEYSDFARLSISDKVKFAEDIEDRKLRDAVLAGKRGLEETAERVIRKTIEERKVLEKKVASLEEKLNEADRRHVEEATEARKLFEKQAEVRDKLNSLSKLINRKLDEGARVSDRQLAMRGSLQHEFDILQSQVSKLTNYRNKYLNEKDKTARRDNRIAKLTQQKTELEAEIEATRKELNADNRKNVNLLLGCLADVRKQMDELAREAAIDEQEAIARAKAEISQRWKQERLARQMKDHAQSLKKQIFAPPGDKIIHEYRAMIYALQSRVDPKSFIYQERKSGKFITYGEYAEMIKQVSEDEIRKQLGDHLYDTMKNRVAKALANGYDALESWDVVALERLANEVQRLRKEGTQLLEAKRIRERILADSDRLEIINSMISTPNSKSLRWTTGYDGYNPPAPVGTIEARKERMGFKEQRRYAYYATLTMSRKAQLLDGDKKGKTYDLLVTQKRRHRDAWHRNMDKRIAPINKAFEDAGKTVNDLYVQIPVVLQWGFEGTYTLADLMYVYAARNEKKNMDAVAWANLVSDAEKERMFHDENQIAALGTARFNQLVKIAETRIEDSGLMPVFQAIENDLGSRSVELQRVLIDIFNNPMELIAYYLPIYRLALNGRDIDELNGSSLFNLATGKQKSTLDTGSAKQRVEMSPDHQTPVNLDLFQVWYQSVQEQEYVIEFGSYVKHIENVFQGRGSRDLNTYIRGTYGDSMLKDVDAYVNDLYRPNEFRKTKEEDRLLKMLRGNLGSAYLSWKLSGIILQGITSPGPFLSELKVNELASAYLKLFRNYADIWDFITKKSQMMKDRSMNTIIDDLHKAMASGTQNKAQRTLNKINDIGIRGLEGIDRVCVAGGWMAAYDKEYARLVNKEKLTDAEADIKAIEYADEFVLRTQPTGDRTELAPLFTMKGEAWKAFTQFQTALNVIWNNIAFDLPQFIRHREFDKAVGTVGGYVLAGLILGLVAEGYDDDDELKDKLLKPTYWATTQFTGAFPLIGNYVDDQTNRLLTGERGYTSTTMYPAIDKLFKSANKVVVGNIPGAAADLAEGFGLFVGLPTSGTKEFIRIFTETPLAPLGRRE